MKTIKRISTNLVTKQTREIIYTKVENNISNISPLYLSSDGNYYTIGKLGFCCVDKYLNQSN